MPVLAQCWCDGYIWLSMCLSFQQASHGAVQVGEFSHNHSELVACVNTAQDT